jgi:hypothetical protein
MCSFGTQEADSLKCYFSPDFQDNSIDVKRVSGSFTIKENDASFRVDISLNDIFKGELVFESRSKSGELLSRNAVYIHQQTPAEMSIEFRLKNFVRQPESYLLLNYNLYE